VKGGILLISWTVPPAASGSAIIVGNLARQFNSDEMVLVGEKPPNAPTVRWSERWPAIHLLNSSNLDNRRGARWIRRLQFPWMLSRTVRLAKQFNCRKVVAVFPKEDHLLLGYLTALRTGAAFFPYFHNTYLDQRQGIEGAFARWLQPRVFQAATRVFVMSEGMVELYRERYPGVRCSALVHSFNDAIPAFAPPPAPGPILNFVFSGNVNESCRDAAVRLCDAVVQSRNTKLNLLSGTSRAYLARLGILRDEVRCEAVSRDDLLPRLREADVVLLPHGFNGSGAAAEYRTIFPTKTIEYLISGRPILAHAPPDCFLTKFLKRHDCALLVDNRDPNALRQAIERLRTDADLRAALVRNALQAARQFQADRVAAEFRRALGDSYARP
jgi:glycosyltransferase involved in cell wall biosynthesis